MRIGRFLSCVLTVIIMFNFAFTQQKQTKEQEKDKKKVQEKKKAEKKRSEPSIFSSMPWKLKWLNT